MMSAVVMSLAALIPNSVTLALSVTAVRLMLVPAVISFVPPAPLRSMLSTLLVAVRLPLVAVKSTFAARSTRLKFWIVSELAAVMFPLMSSVSSLPVPPANVAVPSASAPLTRRVSVPVSLSSTVKLCVPVPSVTFESVMAP